MICAPIVTAIPAELRERPAWVVWTYPKKIPHDPTTGLPASSSDPATWRTFDEAVAAYEADRGRWAGIGYAFSPNDPYCGIDLDDCLDVGGIPYPLAWRMIEKLGSYAEVSPSGRGVKVITRAAKPGPKCKAPFEWEQGVPGQIEIYDSGRYFTITGNVLPDTPEGIMDRQAAVSRLYRHLFPPAPLVVSTRTPQQIVERVLKYLDKCPDSISGQNGHDKALRAACECMRFGLPDADAYAVMAWWSAAKSGGEPWSDREIRHKIESAREKVGGDFGIRLRPGFVQPERIEIETPPAGASEQLAVRVGQIKAGAYASAPLCWTTLRQLAHPLLPGSVTLFCGTPGAGKTFWVLSTMLGWLEAGVPFATFMLEEDRTYYLQRTLAILAGNSNLTDLDWVKMHAADANAERIKHARTLDAIGAAIHDAPERRVSLMQLADWYEQVAGTVRVAVIDPVTAASAGRERWLEDGVFVERIKTAARQSGTSLVLVTHPKLGKRAGPPTLDDMAGGADYPRFTQTVFVLSKHDPETPVECSTVFGRTQVMGCNRTVKVEKARNGRGEGMRVAFVFDPKTLGFNERGVVING